MTSEADNLERDELASASDALPSPGKWEDTFGIREAAAFATTQWTAVLSLQSESEEEAAKALSRLCRTYWYPLYAYVRRNGRSPEEAQDLTQEFFARLLRNDTFARAQKEKGKLRTFLLTVMKRFLINEWERARAEKRGGGREHLSIQFDEGEDRYGHEPVDRMTPDELYEKQWAVTLLGRVMESLRLDYAGRGTEERFEAFKDALWWNSKESSYAEIGSQLGMKENAVKQGVSRLRLRYRQRLREEIASTLDTNDEQEIDNELKHLVAALRSG